MTLVEETSRADGSARRKQAAASTNVIVGVLAATGVVVSLAQTLVVPIIGVLPQIFHTSPSTASWIVTVTLLCGAVSTPVLGRLADMYGKKRMLLLAAMPFIAGSVVCAVATDVITMIIARGLQGLAAGMIPLGISLLHDVVPKDKAGSAIALMSSSMGIGGALGLPIAAGVSEFADWRILFWVTAAAAVGAAVAIWRLIPGSGAPGHDHRFDYIGAVGLILGLVPLLLAVSKGSEWGWSSAQTLGFFAVAVIVLGMWGCYELRRRGPLVDLRTAARPIVMLTNLASILVGFAMYAMNLILPQVMQLPVTTGYGLGQTMFQMGMWMAPMGLGMMAVSKLGAGVSRRHGPKVTLAIAGIVIAAGYGAVAVILGTLVNHPPGYSPGTVTTVALILLLVSTTLIGCGVGFAFGAMPALILSAVPANEKAAANGFNSLMRSAGVTVSAAVIGAVLAATTQQVGGHAVPTLGGFVISLLIGCGGALFAALIATFIPRKDKSPV